MNDQRIAVVGIACHYPDADSPRQLWENVLAGRRAFRRLPDERMNHQDYYSADPSAPDRFYSAKAAVIEGWEFDRVHYRIAGSTYRSTDLTHWLSLDTVANALADAQFPLGEGLPRDRTGVVIGNSLTGEFTRANIMRLRWPYVRRTVGSALREQGWSDKQLGSFLDQLEVRYKSPFPAIDEDTLAGALANTISGRICNYFDFHGGGYTVDGACSSSLLSVATACNALAAGQLDAAVAGGVDLSIDPFEVIGFAKTGALATGEMRVYDRRSNGFWPGEGCGMLVLMRDEDAVARRLRRYATIVGWGYSSDGKGGMTRPEADGHRLAIQRAYEVAGFGIDTVAYLEGHGTGTAVGDATELRAFSAARHAAGPDAPPAAISTIKGNIGHTKAAAGVAGLLKSILAVHHQVIPPATGHVDPHPELGGDDPALRVPDTAELWPAGMPVRAGVSSMGFGGINAHVVIEHANGSRKSTVDDTARKLVRSRQDTELLLVDAANLAELRGKITRLTGLTAKLSYAELGDLAATLAGELAGRRIRAAVVASTPEEAQRGFEKMLTLLDNGAQTVLDVTDGVLVGNATSTPRIGYLFPGQGAGKRADGGALRKRFETVDELYRSVPQPTGGDLVATSVAQPRIATSSVAGLRVLAELGIEAVGAAGHSLGEITALHWAGAMDEDMLLDMVTARGRIMADLSDGNGAMASISASADGVEPLMAGENVVIAGYNSPQQTVVSGPADAVERVCARAVASGLNATRIAVSHAFHSAAVAPAATALRAYLETHEFTSLARPLHSTVTANVLIAEVDVPTLLERQVLDPVRFSDAVRELAADVDLLLEVGPGRVLRGLAGDIAPHVPVISLETDNMSLSGMLLGVGAAYVLGAPVRHEALFHDRFTRPLPLDKVFTFFESPCEAAPAADFAVDRIVGDPPAEGPVDRTEAIGGERETSVLDLVRRLAAERAELPLTAVSPDSQPLDELHLSSITVGQIMNQAAAELGLSAPLATSTFATSTLAELAEMLDVGTTAQGGGEEVALPVAGVGPWVRAFAVDLVPTEHSGNGGAQSVPGDWQLYTTERHPLATRLHAELGRAGLGDGVLLCLPTDVDEKQAGLMLSAARAALSIATRARFVVIGDRRGAAGLAKTLHLEVPSITTTVVTLPLTVDWADEVVSNIVRDVIRDVADTTGFSEVDYDLSGVRRVPVLRPVSLKPGPASGFPLSGADVLLVTGGGKGITAECALALAVETGASVGLVGRSDPAGDAELNANLDRMAAAGVTYRYVRADVTSADEVKAAVDEIRRVLGPVTAVLHGAGRNEPRSLASLDESSFRRTLAPKIAGVEAVLAATDPSTLRLLVTFGSIIGRAGLRGQADYATANDWLTELTRRVGRDYPDCRCVALEWSVWSGSGMGERLGVLESLMREGIEPIPTEAGIRVLKDVLSDPDTPDALVVMGRSGGLPTIAFERQELPLLRFVDRPQVHCPGIELVVDADLSAVGDLYLADHVLDGDLLFPAVFGMEAMCQAASALTGSTGAPVLENVEFLRPIVVPAEGHTTIRVAVLATGNGRVDAVIRSSETGFQADHFRASLHYASQKPQAGEPLPATELLPLDPVNALYGPVLFQGNRFQRLRGYRYLSATCCVADIANGAGDPWFAAYLPSDLMLGDPGTRDAVMHSIQCNVPDATLLPAAVERLYLADPQVAGEVDRVVLHARERLRDGDTYVYDVDVLDEAGNVLERWEGLRLRAVRKLDGSGPWVPALLGPYLERRTQDVLPASLRVVVWPDGDEPAAGTEARRRQTARAISQALGRDTVVRYRPDGKPEVDDGVAVSSSHGAGVTFSVTGAGTVACDVEVAANRSAEEWSGLLAADGLALAALVSKEGAEDLSIAATRVWGAQECLRKVGRANAGSITVEASTGRWLVLRSGPARIATFPTALNGVGDPVVFSMLVEGDT